MTRAQTLLSAIVAAVLIPIAGRAQEATQSRDTLMQKADSAAQAPVDLEALTGFYEIAPGRGLTISVDKGTLYGQPSSGEKRKLVHQSGTLFAVDGTKMTLTFMLGSDGKATDIIMAQNGQQRFLPRR